MPLRSDLLTPISRDRPCGESLRYSATYEKIKEARREEHDLPQGEWERERKTADWPLAIKLICQALAAKTKDLQLAVWLAEAMLRQEGASGLRDALDLIRGLIEKFCDGLYPELEASDAEVRAAPLWWLGTSDKLLTAVWFLPLTQGGLTWLQYRESRWVGSAAADSYEKQRRLEEAIGEGKLTEEEFERDFAATPGTFYAALEETLDGTLESLNQLSLVCDQRFGEVSPSFRWLRKALQEVRQTTHILLVRKREKGPADEPGVTPEAAVKLPEQLEVPQSAEDAIERIVTDVAFLRRWDPYDPAPYLLLRVLRWGELRTGASIDSIQLAAPPTEVRQAIERAAAEGRWMDLLEAAESAMGTACGRGWLDLQLYVARACSKLGHFYDPIRNAVISAVQALLTEYPRLPIVTMSDGSPAANLETRRWIEDEVILRDKEKASTVDSGVSAKIPEIPAPPPDVFELAAQSARSGSAQEGIELLMRRTMEEPSGRKRFERKVQVAQLCMSMGIEAVALPLLREAAAEIERRGLEDWEAAEIVAQPLAMLYRCLVKNAGTEEELMKLRVWISRLDPTEALNLEK